ncbi:DUF4189 domain-containing protein [Stenotrophomonas sp. 278]|nr:DUF4189 domain-containing protein [Stenotrophomonas sp. 278]
MRRIAALLMIALSFGAYAEGRCPPGQYPVGDQNAGGCAPIPGYGGGSGSQGASGEWLTRWGAIAEDFSAHERGVATATGVAESRRSKREAGKVAVDQCQKAGGLKCKVVASYYNQCIAIADPKPKSQGGPGGKSNIFSAVSEDRARSEALRICGEGSGSQCTVAYSACSMSEFRKF